jgi:O-antigen/teichoic acid export membrane protein
MSACLAHANCRTVAPSAPSETSSPPRPGQPSYLISFMDQALFSLGNFLLSIGLVRVYSAEEYAGYGIALSIALTLQAMQRGFTIKTSLLSSEAFASKAGSLLAAHLVIIGSVLAIVLASYCALVALSASSFRLDIAAAALACIAVFFEIDVNRVFLLKRNAQNKSLLMSTSIVAAYGLVVGLGYAEVVTFRHSMLILAAISVATSAQLVWRGTQPRFREGLRELGRDIRTLFAWTTLGAIAAGTYMHIPLFVLATVHPAVQAAGYVMTRNMLQPLGVIMRSLDLVDKHSFASRRIRGDEGSSRLIVRILLRNLLVSASIACAIAFMAAAVLELAYGKPAAAFAPALQLWAPVFVVMATILPLETVLFSRGLARPYALVTSASAVVALLVTYPLVSGLAAIGAVMACLIGYSIQATGAVALAWWAWRHARRTRIAKDPGSQILATEPT